jgi:TolB-like protein/tetratricopeptide (TPR) repeat protein
MGAESDLERPADGAPALRDDGVWARIRSHKIIQWGIGYLGAALALAQAQELIANTFDWPSAVGRLFVVALIGGLPIVLTLAWYHGHRGLQRVTAGELAIISALLLIAALFFTIALRPSDEARSAASATAQTPVDQAGSPAANGGGAADAPPANSIAVLPFLNISSDPEQEFFADGLSEELMNQLAQISELRVTARTSSFAFKGRTENVSSIGEQLGVAHVLEGSVRKAGDRVLITAQLIETANGFHLWSSSFNRALDDIFAVQEEISREVASALKVTLRIDQDLRVDGGTRNVDAYQLFLETTQRTGRGLVFNVVDRQLELIEQALALDPNFALAWARKSELVLFLRLDAARDAVQLQATAEQAAQRAVELAPNSVIARASLARAMSWRGQWSQAEAEYRNALSLGELATRGVDYGLLKLVVGHSTEGRDRLVAQKALDPLNDSLLAFLAGAHDTLGDTQAAMAEYARGFTLIRNWIGGVFNLALTNAGIADYVPTDQGPPPFGPFQGVAPVPTLVAPIIASWDDSAAALAAVRDAYAKLETVPATTRTLVRLNLGGAAARFGDPELALRAFEESMAWSPEQLQLVWRPVFREVRRLPRFKEFVRAQGLVAYWEQYGWPEHCRAASGGDFNCD